MFIAHFDDAPPISLEELVDGVERTLRPDDLESMEACSPLLAGYSRDPGILPRLVNESVREMLKRRIVAPVRTPQSFVIAMREHFYVRCNLWMPLKASPALRPHQERLYSLEVAHDHNFSFLTVGHLGPGYRTDLFEYDRGSVAGRVGEKVDLRPTGSYSLGIGDVMLYRQGVDVHVQHQPDAPSASINLMFLSERTKREWQYLFDVEKGEITGRSGAAIGSRHELLLLAGEIGDAGTAELVEQVSSTCPCPSTRQAGAVALRRIAERL